MRTLDERMRRYTRRERAPNALRVFDVRGPDAVDLFKRAWELARRFERGERLTYRRVMELFNVSAATAKRDITAIRVLLFGDNYRCHPEFTRGAVFKRGRA